jgi:hypothetical protein
MRAQDKKRESMFGVPWREGWLGADPDLYRPELWAPAHMIPVRHLRHTLVWPLALRLTGLTRDGASSEEVVRRGVDAARRALERPKDTGNPWVRVDDLLDHARPDCGDSASAAEQNRHDAMTYGEFVYVYDYLQKTLYGKAEGRRAGPITLFRRNDISSIRWRIWRDGDSFGGPRVEKFTARVERCNLYLLETGVAVLALELDYRSKGFFDSPTITTAGAGPATTRPMMLSDAQKLSEKIRRVYTAYHDPSTTETATARGVPLQVRLRHKRESLVWCVHGPNSLSDDVAFIKKHDGAGRRTAPLASHFRDLIRPLVVAGDPEQDVARPSIDRPVWRQVIDERAPLMTYVSLTGAQDHASLKPNLAEHARDTGLTQDQEALALVARGDWQRLCFADGPGSKPFPYTPAFLADFEPKHCYDRFFPSPAHAYGVRYMFAGYHTVAVGAGDSFDSLIMEHWRRHYFQFCLLLTIEFATLIALSGRVSEAVDEMRAEIAKTGRTARIDRRFRATMIEVERDLMEFMHTPRFTNVSNQVQPIEMFTLWRERLGLKQIFDDVKEEIDTANHFLLATEQAAQTDAATSLSVVATLVASLGWAHLQKWNADFRAGRSWNKLIEHL